MKKTPQVDVGVIIIKNDTILLGKRKGSHSSGTWCMPGGHLEFGETFKQCATREVLEETGLNIKNLRLGIVTNDVLKKENKHYVSITMVADYDGGKPRLLEPDRCAQWQWFQFNKLPSPLCLPNRHAIEQEFNPLETDGNYS